MSAKAAGAPGNAGTAALFPIPGQADTIEQAIHKALASPGAASAKALDQAVAAEAQKILAQLLASMQGRPGQTPLGYPPGSFGLHDPEVRPGLVAAGPTDTKRGATAAPAATATAPASDPGASNTRLAEAKRLAADGPLKPAEPSAKPALSDAEKQAMSEQIGKADGDKAKALAQDPKVLENASPEDKAKIFHKLQNNTFGGIHNPEQNKIAVDLLKSCKTKDEFDRMVAALGGKDKVADYFHEDSAKQAFKEMSSTWEAKGKEAGEKAVALLEQASSPEEALQIAEQLGGPGLKHQIKDPRLLDRLNALAKRFELPALGYGISGEQVVKKREQLAKASQDDAIKLAEDKDALAIASPAEKAALIKKLNNGKGPVEGPEAFGLGKEVQGTLHERNSMAIYRVLSSSRSKEEYDATVDRAGGKMVLQSMGGDESRAKMNKLAGAWGRLDIATKPEVAKQTLNSLADPAKCAELSSMRPPTDAEKAAIGGNPKLDGLDPNDPLQRKFAQAAPLAKQHMAKQAYDVDFDPQAKTELVLEQRDREVQGKPKLDYTKLVSEADAIMSDPNFDQKCRDRYNIDRVCNRLGPNDPVPKDVKESYVTAKMQELGKKEGLSEQTMKQLVTQRLGKVYEEGAGVIVANGGGDAILKMRQRLQELEKAGQKDGAEAQKLRAEIEKFNAATGGYMDKLAQSSEICKSMFPVPPNVGEMFGSFFGQMFGAIGDVLAGVMKLVPGWGQTFSAIYTAIKSISSGNPLAGVTGLAGVALSPAIDGNIVKQGLKFVERSAQGDILDGVSGLSKDLGGAIGEEAIKMGRNVAKGDGAAVLAQLGQGVAMLTGAGGAVGQFASIAKTGIGLASSGVQVADRISKNDPMGAVLGALGGIAGAVGNQSSAGSVLNNVMGWAKNGFDIGDKLSHGDFGGALAEGIGLVSPMVKDPSLRSVLDATQTALPGLQKLANGDFAGGLSSLASHLAERQDSPGVRDALQMVSKGASFADALGKGDFGRAMGSLAGSLQGLSSDAGFQKITGEIARGGDVARALQAGDSKALIASLGAKGGLLDSMTPAGFGRAMDDLGHRAESILGSPEWKTATDLTRAGTQLFQGIASGDFDKALTAMNGLGGPVGALLPELRSMVQGIAPLAQAMFSGGFPSALGQLSQVPGAQEVARSLGSLQPIAGLASGTALSGLHEIGGALQTVAGGLTLNGAGLSAGNAGQIGRPEASASALDLVHQMMDGTSGLAAGLAGTGTSSAIENALAILPKIGDSKGAAAKLTDILQSGRRFVEALGNGTWSDALQNVAGALENLQSTPASAFLRNGMESVAAVARGLEPTANGGPSRTLQGSAAGEAMSVLASGVFSRGLDELAAETERLTASSELRSLCGLVLDGTRFASSATKGDLKRTLGEVADQFPGASEAMTRLQEALRRQETVHEFQDLASGQLEHRVNRVSRQIEELRRWSTDRARRLRQVELESQSMLERLVKEPRAVIGEVASLHS